MARPWIEFVQSQALPWQGGGVWGARPGVESKVLSLDPEDGAASLLLRYPKGWSAGGSDILGADEELFVLDGGLTMGGRSYSYAGYAHLPAGYERKEFSAPEGAVVLTFFSRRPERRGAAARFDAARLVERLDAFGVPYTGNFHPQFPPGAGRKMLYQDPQSGDQTWLLATLAMRWAERAEVHPTVEEMYLLAGEVHSDRGVMRPGAYFWRPPQKPHGPFGSLTGNLYFFRTKGGPLSTTYVDAARPFRWWPEDNPVLPSGLAADRGAAPPAPRPW